MDTTEDAEKKPNEEVSSPNETVDIESTAPNEVNAPETPEEVSDSKDDTSFAAIPSVPQSAPVAAVVAPPTLPVASVQPDDKQQNNPITLVLQWLTYAFWGWFALSILWLSAVTVMFLVVGADSADWTSTIAYPIAAVVVLFLVAAGIDFFYARREPAHKQSFASAIMVIHAVIFALCGIGAVIAAVFALVNLMLGAGESKAILTSLYVAIIMFAVYLVLIARTTLVSKIRRISWIATGVFGALAVIFIILGIVGPVAQSISTRQDRELESALPQVPGSIDVYVQEHKKLPTTLSDLTFTSYSYASAEDTKATIAKGLIKYTANTKSPVQSDDGMYKALDTTSVKDSSIAEYYGGSTYYYRLCVTWQAEKNYDDTSRSYPVNDPASGVSSPSYGSYISAYTHKKGEQCYDLSSTSY